MSADFSKSDAFDKVVKLQVRQCVLDPEQVLMDMQTGQALILAPSGLGVFSQTSSSDEVNSGSEGKGDGGSATGEMRPTVAHIGRRYVIMKTRRRVTADGGASILAVAEA